MKQLSSNEVVSNDTLNDYSAMVTFVIQPDGGSVDAQVLVGADWVTIESYSDNASVDINIRGQVSWRFTITGSGTVHYYL